MNESHGVWIRKTVRRDCGGAMRRDDARNLLRRTIESMLERYRVPVYAWAMLPSKVEMVLGPSDAPIQQVVGEAFGYFTRRFNARYVRTGPLFRTKFLKRVLASPEAVRRAVHDVNMAPLRKDLIRRPGHEPYGSADVYLRGIPDGIVTPYPGVMEPHTLGPTWASGT